MSEEDYDPFAAFDAASGGVIRDPHPDFVEKRKNTPVWKGSLFDASVLPEGIELDDDWVIYRYDDCSRVLRDAATFTSTGYDDSIGLVMGHMILAMDDPEHRRHRNLVAGAFREKTLALWEPAYIAPICNELIDRFIDNGSADLVRELTFEFPVRVIARILGLPEEDFATFQRWSIELIGIMGDIDKGLAASEKLRNYFKDIVADRRKTPRDDVISDLVAAEIDGEKLTDEAIYSFLLLLLPAGAETTYRSSGSLLYLLLTGKRQYETVRADRSLFSQAMEEALRFEPPLVSINRSATKDVTVAGVTIPKGGSVAVCLGSANRDETRWERADEFDIFRTQIPHLAFAHGPHMCLGMHLARLETRVLIDAVMDRLSNVELHAKDSDAHIHGAIFRSPTALPVTFSAT